MTKHDTDLIRNFDAAWLGKKMAYKVMRTEILTAEQLKKALMDCYKMAISMLPEEK